MFVVSNKTVFASIDCWLKTLENKSYFCSSYFSDILPKSVSTGFIYLT